MKIKKSVIYVILAVVLLAAVFSYYKFFYNQPNVQEQNPAVQEPEWYVDNSGILHYTQNRGDVLFSRQTYNETDALLISKIVYKSKGTNIYG